MLFYGDITISESYSLPFVSIRNVLLDFFVQIEVNHPNLVNLVSIATVPDKHNVPFVQKVSNVRTLHQNPQHVQRVYTVLRVMQHVQFAQRGMNVQMVHRPEYVLRDSLHRSVPQHVKPVLLVIDAHVKACLPLRAVQRDCTPTRPCKWDVTLVKQGGNVQMVIDLCHVLLDILVNMGSPTVHPVNQESTAALVHLCVCRVLLENNVWTLVSSQWIVLMGHFLALEKVFVRCVHKVSSKLCFREKRSFVLYMLESKRT